MGNIPRSHLDTAIQSFYSGQLEDYEKWLLKKMGGMREFSLLARRQQLVKKKKNGRHGRVNFTPTKFFRSRRKRQALLQD